MLNFKLGPLFDAMRFIRDHRLRAVSRVAMHPNTMVDGAILHSVVNNVGYLGKLCSELGLPRTDDRILRINEMFGRRFTFEHLEPQLTVLLEAVEDDLQKEYFYHYHRDKAFMVVRIPGDWAPTIKAFKSTKPEIEDAVDCWALEMPTAAIFHLMRVAEYGLRALAKERKIKLPKGKPLEWGNWQEIIKEVKTAADLIGKSKRPGAGKDEALAFYNGAVAHFDAFKDKYRNTTMHVRKRYKPFEAEQAMNQVRDFMNDLSLKIGEDTKGAIKWKF